MNISSKKAPPELLIFDEIGPTWTGAVSAEKVIEQLNKIGAVPELIVRINSPGGDVFEASAIYNALVRQPSFVTVVIEGLAASAASHIMLAGDDLVIQPNAFVMVHNAWSIVMGNASELEKNAAVLRKIDESLIDAYARRSGQSKLQIRTWMNEETWFTANEAVTARLADSVGSGSSVVAAKVPAGRYKRTPAALIGGQPTAFDQMRRPVTEQFPARDRAKQLQRDYENRERMRRIKEMQAQAAAIRERSVAATR